MPYYIPRNKIREVTPPKFRNPTWEGWGLHGFIPGILLAFSGLIISIVEIVRIIYGVTNRGIHNYDNTGSGSFSIAHESLLWKVDPVNFPSRVEKFHYWPWSYAANLFGLVTIMAGMTGIVSYYRRSYSTVFVFMTLSLMSSFFSLYLIAYYAQLVSYYIIMNWDSQQFRSQTMDTSWALIGVNLAMSCGIFVIGMIAALLGFRGIRAGQQKGLHLEKQYSPYAERPGNKGKIVPANYAV